MPKRTRSSRRDNEEYERIARKIQRLTEELGRARPRRRQRIISSSSSSTSPSRDSLASLIAQEESQHVESQPENEDERQELEPEPSTSTVEPAATTVTETPVVPELDEETLLILGDDPSDSKKKYGKDIQVALAVRLQHIATEGLTKEQRKELQDKHLLPANCLLIDGPLLNPEIKAAVSEVVAKRDRGIEHKQKQMAKAISSVGEAITLLISSEDKNPPMLRLLMDAARLMCDCQHTDTAVRRNFILQNLKKDMKDQLQSTKVDTYLFGQDLADTLKSAKAICKSGAELKTAPAKPPVKKPTAKPAANRSYSSPNLNWKAPPRAAGSRGHSGAGGPGSLLVRRGSTPTHRGRRTQRRVAAPVRYATAVYTDKLPWLPEYYLGVTLEYRPLPGKS